MIEVPEVEIVGFFDWLERLDISSASRVYGDLLRSPEQEHPFLDDAAMRYVEWARLRVPWDRLVYYSRLYVQSPYVPRRDDYGYVFVGPGSDPHGHGNSARDTPMLGLMIQIDEIALILTFLDWASSHEVPLNRASFRKGLLGDFFLDNPQYDSGEHKRIIRRFIKSGRRGANGLDRILRYRDPSIWKCVVLGLRAEPMTTTLMTRYWEDLDTVTYDYLDIFYSDYALGRDGNRVANSLFPEAPFDEFPCLAVWRESVDDARFISLQELDERQAYRVVAALSKAIRQRHGLDDSVRMASQRAAEFRLENRRRTMNITQNGVNNAVVLGPFEGGQHVVVQDQQLQSEVREAQRRVDELEGITDEMRAELHSVLEMVASGSDAGRLESRNRMRGLAEKGLDIVGLLANLAALCTFFGFQPCT